ncbi:MAG TPA: hypothetical protein VL117_04225 [Thermoleophilia bacterium]|nr:hypothetical protein [Thermoleophilia bacterium]
MRARHLALLPTLAALLALAALPAAAGLLGGCSSNAASTLPDQVPSASGSPSPAPASAFGQATSKKYGLTLRYPLGWVSAAREIKAGDKAGSALISLTWADPKGKVVGGGFVDTLHVSVYAMSKPVKPGDVTRHKSDFEAIAYSMIKALPSLAMSGPFKPITVNGTGGLQITYAYRVQGARVGAMSYLLPKGKYAYWVSGQSSADTWSAAWSKLAPAMASFTITAQK